MFHQASILHTHAPADGTPLPFDRALATLAAVLVAAASVALWIHVSFDASSDEPLAVMVTTAE
jgi:hypothetical protein